MSVIIYIHMIYWYGIYLYYSKIGWYQDSVFDVKSVKFEVLTWPMYKTGTM